MTTRAYSNYRYPRIPRLDLKIVLFLTKKVSLNRGILIDINQSEINLLNRRINLAQQNLYDSLKREIIHLFSRVQFVTVHGMNLPPPPPCWRTIVGVVDAVVSTSHYRQHSDEQSRGSHYKRE